MEVSVTGHSAAISDVRSREALHFEVAKAHTAPQSILYTLTSLLYILLLQPIQQRHSGDLSIISCHLTSVHQSYHSTQIMQHYNVCSLWLFGEPRAAK